ncbi:hypothetical protein PPERSA_02907 [Pseudocohnilembus persalinus]|uniref:C2H2-type domain-containing protein n=1 Tax=Pseudocohnilembus persalinus TaxID=266149 RepID=A0A0V0QN89_PSEPJ|nr:hypothetical protein PPERSA_02907 [Pseudocohnilembus persalinus]|eukprot:KRX03528.1 hypothetical protein PPERSA_02907 [Pseudocohnilembus persalinus]
MGILDQHQIQCLDGGCPCQLDQNELNQEEDEDQFLDSYDEFNQKHNYNLMHKEGMLKLDSKSLVIKVIEYSLNQMIEMQIKDQDKANLYSIKIKDVNQAKTYIRLEKLVNCERDVTRHKQQLKNLFQEKIQWLENQINGYDTLNHFFNDTINLMTQIQKVEKDILKTVIIKARLLNDPKSALKFEHTIQEKFRREKNEKGTINSLGIVKGEIGFIFASFLQEKGRILKFSERMPKLLGYDNNEFGTIQNIKKLMPDCIANIHDEFLTRIIEEKSDKHYILLDKQGYIQGFNKEFAQIVHLQNFHPDDLQNLHISLLIPECWDYFQDCGKSDKFLKFEMQLPKNEGIKQLKNYFTSLLINIQIQFKDLMNEIVEEFVQHHDKVIKNQMYTRAEWEENLDEFLDIRDEYITNSDPCYELIANFIEDKIALYSGQTFNLYIIEIEQINDKEQFNVNKLKGSFDQQSKKDEDSQMSQHVKNNSDEEQSPQIAKNIKQPSIFLQAIQFKKQKIKEAKEKEEQYKIEMTNRSHNIQATARGDNKEIQQVNNLKVHQINRFEESPEQELEMQANYIDGVQNEIQQSSIIKNIYTNIQNNNIPKEIRLLQRAFLSQILLFCLITIILILVFINAFDRLINTINQTSNLQQFLNPLFKSVIVSNAFVVNNLAQDISGVTLQQLDNQNYAYIQEQTDTSYKEFKDGLELITKDDIQYQYQEQIYQIELEDIYLVLEGEKIQTNMKIFEFLKNTGQNMFQLMDKEKQLGLNFLSDSPYDLNQNLPQFYKNIVGLMDYIKKDKNNTTSDIKNLNLFFIIISLIVLSISFIVIIPGFRNFKLLQERICMLISRIKQGEADYTIQMLKFILEQVYSHDEQYLTSNFTNYLCHDIKELQNDFYHQSIHPQKKNKKKQVFYQVQSFDHIFNPVSENFINLITAQCQFSAAFSSHRIRFLQYFTDSLQQQNIQIDDILVSEEAIQQIEELKSSTFQNSYDYFSSNYKQFSQDSYQTEQFTKYMKDINSGNLCANEVLSDYQELCKNTQLQVLERGLQLSIQNMQNQINSQVFEDFEKCGKVYSQYSSLYSHLKSIHKLEKNICFKYSQLQKDLNIGKINNNEYLEKQQEILAMVASNLQNNEQKEFAQQQQKIQKLSEINKQNEIKANSILNQSLMAIQNNNILDSQQIHPENSNLTPNQLQEMSKAEKQNYFFKNSQVFINFSMKQPGNINVTLKDQYKTLKDKQQNNQQFMVQQSEEQSQKYQENKLNQVEIAKVHKKYQQMDKQLDQMFLTLKLKKQYKKQQLQDAKEIRNRIKQKYQQQEQLEQQESFQDNKKDFDQRYLKGYDFLNMREIFVQNDTHNKETIIRQKQGREQQYIQEQNSDQKFQQHENQEEYQNLNILDNYLDEDIKQETESVEDLNQYSEQLQEYKFNSNNDLNNLVQNNDQNIIDQQIQKFSEKISKPNKLNEQKNEEQKYDKIKILQIKFDKNQVKLKLLKYQDDIKQFQGDKNTNELKNYKICDLSQNLQQNNNQQVDIQHIHQQDQQKGIQNDNQNKYKQNEEQYINEENNINNNEQQNQQLQNQIEYIVQDDESQQISYDDDNFSYETENKKQLEMQYISHLPILVQLKREQDRKRVYNSSQQLLNQFMAQEKVESIQLDFCKV